MNGENGYPYGVPLDHYYDREKDKLYFHGGLAGYRIDCVERDPKVSYCVVSDPQDIEGHWAKKFCSVIVFGTIRFIKNPAEIADITRKLSYRFTDDTAYIEGEIKGSLHKTSLWEMSIDYISGKQIVES